MNKVDLCGYLGRDFELRYSNAGNVIASNSLAITKKWTDSNGNRVEHTDWIPIKLFGKTAEVVNQYFKQGSQFLCSGELATDEYIDNNGNTRYIWEVRVKEFYWLNQKGNKKDVCDPNKTENMLSSNLEPIESIIHEEEMQNLAKD
ncbi:single-stranded DNA-binding protein [Campylobacter pinnipediorum subsp. pinnipediorum]|uniref:Single-stranded DNA-binding protein n=1 Tax=Campylobacter pinnipediorum subsp. pinnipediorum TaxID=1660067 RepID=A0AAX0LBE2_9BACT|nr:single-stranded DNA-binding protein [Campylobacter pinnipediorum]AQW80372.1 single-stranded DNA-binding protein [Campylobacter pinnipediorum subsp. pinnipediorum]OPA80745.1 single-stranded DNA-binding protein [Campylobacter pinnipediorum subsp. pinnipediorum]